ncbi:MAG TPA: hypothetical protein VFB21_06990 [Chthonomonadaceae bacterium]|nr:hypothetical protein [Chthonomonadaceae bacterium]
MATKATSGYELFSNGCNVSRTSERPMSPATTAALFALRWGATGIGFWCYNIGADSWQRVANDYPIVYPGRTKPVTSRRWEAVREGIEDFRMLAALRKSEATVRDSALKRRIRRLSEVTLPAFTDRSHQEVLVGLGRAAFSESKNDATLAAFRSEMLDCIEAVCREQVKTSRREQQARRTDPHTQQELR